jgi:hypothetical protein
MKKLIVFLVLVVGCATTRSPLPGQFSLDIINDPKPYSLTREDMNWKKALIKRLKINEEEFFKKGAMHIFVLSNHVATYRFENYVKTLPVYVDFQNRDFLFIDNSSEGYGQDYYCVDLKKEIIIEVVGESYAPPGEKFIIYVQNNRFRISGYKDMNGFLVATSDKGSFKNANITWR